MNAPQTNLHYAPNGNFNGTTYSPASVGFNLADVGDTYQVNELPAGVKGLVWLGTTDGATSSFMSAVNQYIGNPKVYGFYLADEPGPNVSAANLKAESDYIHSVDPGAKTFMVLENNGSPLAPSFAFNPANTDIDLFGLDPYPVRPEFNGANYDTIGAAVHAVEAEGVPQADIVPVYQAFGGGGYASWTLPTAAQEQTILSTWGQYIPSPAFDFAYSWGVQDGDTALSSDPALQQVFAAHNASSPLPPPPPPPQTTATLTAADSHGTSAPVPIISSGSSKTTVGTGFVSQTVSAGIDSVTSTAISSETLQLGSGTTNMHFINPAALTVSGATGPASITVDSGTNTFTAGAGALNLNLGSGADALIYHAGDGLLTVSNFSKSFDTLTVDKSLQGSFHQASDGNAGVKLTFGTQAQGIDLIGVSHIAESRIHFV